MKIDRIEVHLLSCPVDGIVNWKSATGRATKKDLVLVEIITDEGVIGWGEAHHALCPPVVSEIITEAYAPLLIGKDPLQINELTSRLFKMGKMLGTNGAPVAAISGVEIALWDIAGKVAGLPVYKMLGAYSDRVRAYAGGWSLGWNEDVGALIEEAQAMVEYGYTAVKMRVGQSVKHDVRCVKALREALGDDIDILTDAAGSYDRVQARYVVDAFQDLGVYWLEEALPMTDIEGLIELSHARKVRIAYGESFYTRYPFTRPIAEKGIDVVQPDVSKCGGILEARIIAGMAESWNIPFAPHIVANAVATAANLQLAGSIRNALIVEIEMPTTAVFRESLVTDPSAFVMENGDILIPQGPGLGIEIDRDALRKFPYIAGSCY